MDEVATIEQPAAVSHRLKAEGMLLLTTLIWGGTFAATKSLLAVLQPMCLLTWRFGLGFILFSLLYAREIREGFRTGSLRSIATHGILLGFFLFLAFGFQTLGLQYTSSGKSGFITVLYVVITPLLQTIVTRRLPSARVVIGIMIVLTGLWSLTAPAGSIPSLLDASGFSNFGRGDVLTLGSALSCSIYMILLDRFTRNGAIAPLTAIQLLVIAILCGTQSLLTEHMTMPIALPDWGKLLYLAIFATVLTTYWQTRYQRDTTPTRAAVIFTLESVFAAILGSFVMNETLGATGVLGGALIVMGLLTVELKRGS